MLYKIIESFSRADGARWTGYCDWRGLQFERFDSIDGIMRPSLFQKPEDDDWAHIVNESVNDTATVPLRGEVAASTALQWRLE